MLVTTSRGRMPAQPVFLLTHGLVHADMCVQELVLSLELLVLHLKLDDLVDQYAVGILEQVELRCHLPIVSAKPVDLASQIYHLALLACPRSLEFEHLHLHTAELLDQVLIQALPLPVN